MQSGDMLPPATGQPFDLLVYLFLMSIGGGPGFTIIDLPEGGIVPPETGYLDVTVTWATGATTTGLRLGFRDAVNKQPTFLDEPLESGKAVRILSNLSMNDMPHTGVSKWRFFLVPHAETGPAVFNGTADVRIIAHRPDVLFLAPPHPDVWGDDTTRSLHEESRAARSTSVLLFSPDEEGFGFVELPNGTIVPPHTRVLMATLEWENKDQTTAALNPRPALCYSPANTRRVFCPEPAQLDGSRAVYPIEVNAKMADSPYATASQWFFLLYLDSDLPTGDAAPFLQVAKFDGTITLRLGAEREPAPE